MLAIFAQQRVGTMIEDEVELVGLGRLEHPTRGLGKQMAVLQGFENFRLYMLCQAVTDFASCFELNGSAPF